MYKLLLFFLFFCNINIVSAQTDNKGDEFLNQFRISMEERLVAKNEFNIGELCKITTHQINLINDFTDEFPKAKGTLQKLLTQAQSDNSQYCTYDKFLINSRLLSKAVSIGDHKKACEIGIVVNNYGNSLSLPFWGDERLKVVKMAKEISDNSCSLISLSSEISKQLSDITANANCPAYLSAKKTCAPSPVFDQCIRRLFPLYKPVIHQYCD